MGKFAVQEAAKNVPVLTQWAQKVTDQDTRKSPGGSTEGLLVSPRGVFDGGDDATTTDLRNHVWQTHRLGVPRRDCPRPRRRYDTVSTTTPIHQPYYGDGVQTSHHRCHQGPGRRKTNYGPRRGVTDPGGLQSTNNLQESNSTAVTNRGIAYPAIWSMLAAAKTISYNAARHVIHLHLFTRAEAQRFEGLAIPFHRHVHALNNAHAPVLLKPEASVWDRLRDLTAVRLRSLQELT